MTDAVDLTDLQARLARLELLLTAQLAAPGPAPTAPSPSPSPPPPKSWLARLVAWMGAELPKLLAAAVLLVLGFALKDSVDLAIKQRQLDLSYTKEMQGLLQQLYGQGRERGQPPSEPELRSAAVLLAAYGEPALPGLLSALRGKDLEMLAAAEGLNALALREPALLCQALPRLLGLRRQYEWQAHELAVQMLGQHGCQQARPALRRYLALVDAAAAGQPQALEALLREPAAAAKEDYPSLQRSVREALSQLEQPAL